MLVFCLVLVFHSGFELRWFVFVGWVMVYVSGVVIVSGECLVADYCWLVSACFAWVAMVLVLGNVWFGVWHLVLAGCWD